MFGFLFLVACSEENSTEQSIAMEEISQDTNSDLFILDSSVYKKVRNLKNADVDMNDYSNIGKITKRYTDDGTFKHNMATVLPIGTEI